MNTKTGKNTSIKSWALPGAKFTYEEFVTKVRKAEQGPFLTPDEFERNFEKWKKEKGYC
jgi:hypothetical protein